MQEYVLTRSGEIPAKISGELIGSSASKNITTPAKESSARQWFTLDVYRTASGRFVAHIKYRAGSRLAREEACDVIEVAPSGERLLAQLQGINPSDNFVVGWPGDGHPDDNYGKDFRENDASVCRYAHIEWDNLLERSAHLFGAVEEIA